MRNRRCRFDFSLCLCASDLARFKVRELEPRGKVCKIESGIFFIEEVRAPLYAFFLLNYNL